MKQTAWITGVASLLAAAAACAGPITVEIDGVVQSTTYNSGDDITIDLGTFSTVRSVRIYDSTLVGGLPDDIIGKVTVNGTPTGSAFGLNFFISGDSTFPAQFTDRIDNLGAYSFGANSSDGLTITNPALERRTRVAIAVVNSIRGTVRAGQLFRIQSGLPNFYPNVDEALQPQVTADLIAAAPDQTWPGIGPLKAIEEVNISGRLRGNIIAEGDTNYVVDLDSTYANIGRVVVRWRDNQSDLEGDLNRMAFGGTYANGNVVGGTIQANRGRITEVICAGRIGTKDADVAENGDQTITGVITAADGIARVSVSESATLANAFRHPWYLDLTANLKTSQPGYNPFSSISPSDRSDNGAINLITTTDDIVGDISCSFLTYTAANQRAGIFSRNGSITGSVNIKYAQIGADIVAKRLVQNVSIGRHLQGSIVALGDFAEFGSGSNLQAAPCNVIGSVEVGLATPSEVALMPSWVQDLNPGFVGSETYVFQPESASEWFDFGTCDADPVSGVTNTCGVTGSKDSVIYAPGADRIELAGMSVYQKALRSPSDQPLPNAPRVMANGNILKVGKMSCGIVYSGFAQLAGDYNDPQSEPFALRLLDWPARWASFEAQCVGANSRIWIGTNRGSGLRTECFPTVQESSIVVHGNMLGELNMLQLAPDDSIIIGEGLIGYSESNCDCRTPVAGESCTSATPPESAMVGVWESETITPNDGTPRGAFRLSNPVPSRPLVDPYSRGVINIASRADDARLGFGMFNGQVTIHANNTSGEWNPAKWTGRVVLGAGYVSAEYPDAWRSSCPSTAFGCVHFGVPHPGMAFNDPGSPQYIHPDYRGPRYSMTPGTLVHANGDIETFFNGFGWGAVGLVPFGIHYAASELLTVTGPQNCFTSGDSASVSRAFSRPDTANASGYCNVADPVDLVFYGPVGRPNNLAPTLTVKLQTPGDTSGCADHADATYVTNVYQDTTQGSRLPDYVRRLGVIGKPGYYFPGSRYTLRSLPPPQRTANGLRCLDLLTTSVVHPLDFNENDESEWFRIDVSCFTLPCVGRALDPEDPNYCPNDELPPAFCDSIDFNNDNSFFDPVDIDAFLSVFSEGPCIPANAVCNDVDFNNDGSLFDPCDVDAFFLVFSEGPCTLCGV